MCGQTRLVANRLIMKSSRVGPNILFCSFSFPSQNRCFLSSTRTCYVKYLLYCHSLISGQLSLSRSDWQNLLQTQIQTYNPSVSVRGSQLLQGSLHVTSCCLRVARQLAAVMLQTPAVATCSCQLIRPAASHYCRCNAVMHGTAVWHRWIVSGGARTAGSKT